MFQIVSTYREFREFLAAKKRKREPLRWRGTGAAEAMYRPSSHEGLANFRAALRRVDDWGQASERLDRIEHALRARSGHGFPLPHKVMQNSDRSLSVFWEGAMIRCLPDGVVSLIGGVGGIHSKGVSTELLDLLAFRARIERSS